VEKTNLFDMEVLKTNRVTRYESDENMWKKKEWKKECDMNLIWCDEFDIKWEG
jgi:hypothetical protein